MRIKKVSQPTPIVPGTAQITDTYSVSTEDGYSCNYINKINFFALDNSESITSVSVTGTASNITSELVINYNDELSVASFGGNITIGKTGATPGNITFNTSLRPSSEITVKGNVLRIISAGTTVENVLSHSMTISTSGVITIAYTFVSTGNDSCRFAFLGFPIRVS